MTPRSLLNITALAGLALALGACHPHHEVIVERQVIVERPPPVQEIIITERREPPPLIIEVVTASPGPDHVWIAGAHEYSRGNWVWVGGHWAKPSHRGAVWHAGEWRPEKKGYAWHAGHWS